MKFNCFPKKQGMYLVYSNYKVFKSRLFSDLILQSSPKNSIFYRILKSRIGFYISSVFKYSIKLPTNNLNYIGIIKDVRLVLFELDEDNTPINVWRKSGDMSWVKEKFIGFQLISLYSLANFKIRCLHIEKAFSIHWKNLNKNTVVHGDFTHFNILVDINEKINFIDDKSHVNSRLFDFFYFYSYLEQCLERCQTITKVDKSIILNKLEELIIKVCSYNSQTSFNNDCSTIKFPESWGLRNENKQLYLERFKERILIRIK